jgi:hypothetical protein
MGKDVGPASAVLRAVFALAAIAATLMWGRMAHADAAPVQLILLYMPNVSNAGPANATGVAELVMSEGEVRIKVADLPRLDGDSRYVVWVVNSTTNDFMRLGAFNTAASTGALDYENVESDAIPDKKWNLLLVTVETSAEPASPSNRHSIAGVFPGPDNAPLPVVLPNTGGAPDEPYQAPQAIRPEWLGFAGLAALVAGVTFVAGYALGHTRR